jgi:hypothetical protein
MSKSMRNLLSASIIVIAGLSAASFAVAEHRGGEGQGSHCKHAGSQQGKHHGCSRHYGKRGYGGMHGHRGKWRWRGKRLERLLDRFDTDKDGKLTQAELDASRKGLFTRYDADTDGKLSLSEFEQLWLDLRRRHMVRGFQHIDEDGDATITAEEFLEPYADAVARMDRDGDGAISGDDRRRRMRGGRGSPPTPESDQEAPDKM